MTVKLSTGSIEIEPGRMYSLREVAEITRLSIPTCRKHLPFRKIGEQNRILGSVLIRYIGEPLETEAINEGLHAGDSAGVAANG